MSNSLFEEVSLETVKRKVNNYVTAHSKNSYSLLERKERGVYRINKRSPYYRQLLVNFSSEPDEPQPAGPVDQGPTLFD